MATPESGRRIKIRARDVFEAYFLKHHREDLTEILKAKEDAELHYPVFVNFLTMFEEHIEVAESLLTSPTKLLPVLDIALTRAATKVLNDLKAEDSGAGFSLKTNLHARITELPSCPELYRHRVPRTADVGRLLCVMGTVVRQTSAKMLEYQKDFMCTKCKHVFTMVADHDQYYHLNRPSRCPNPDTCQSFTFTALSSSVKPIFTKDYQELKIQEQVQKLKVGSIPGSLWVTLEDDLVDSCRPGDDVVVCGVMRQRWRPMNRDVRPSIDLVLRANNVTVNNKGHSGSTTLTEERRKEFAEFWEYHRHDPITARNIILASLCPQVYGLYVVKLAVGVVVAGGVQRTADNTRIRGEAHLLLVGDPGTAKSQFLKYTSCLVPRSVFTTGAGTTSTGLTVTVVRDGGEWTLEAGALVLADGGVCCIDEFSCMREADRTAIHEAMEQQTISVAKAGLLCKLDSRCSVLAATNPKGEINFEEGHEFIGLPSPLLSRFDLVLVLKDIENKEWDRVVSGYILRGQDPGEEEGKGAEEDWDLEKLRAYFCLVHTLQPCMTPQANEVLSRYYQVQRQNNIRSKARTTLRLLESLVRLSQGHARLLMRDTVMVQDAVVAISLLEASMGGFSAVMDVNPLHTAFPHDARQEYRAQVQLILERLSLPQILEEEMTRLNEEDEDLASSRKLPRTCRRRSPSTMPVTSTQKLPSTAVLQSRKDFKHSVNDELSLGIEELDETTGHRKRPRGGAQHTLNKWVDEVLPQSVSIDDQYHDDLELTKPKKQRKKDKEKGNNGKTQMKEVKSKKIKRNTPVDVSGSVPPGASVSVSHVERVGEELLQDLDDFEEDSWTPTKTRESFISSLAKFSYKKAGNPAKTKHSSGQDDAKNENKNSKNSEHLNDSETEGNKRATSDGSFKTLTKNKQHSMSPPLHTPLKERLPGNPNTLEVQEKRANSDLKDASKPNKEEKSHEPEPRKSPLDAGKAQKLQRTLTPSRESVIAKLKQFVYSPPEDKVTSLSPQSTSPSESCQVNKTQEGEPLDLISSEGINMKSKTLCTQIQGDSTAAGGNESNDGPGRSKEHILSLTHTRIKEARDKRLFPNSKKEHKNDGKSPGQIQDSQEDRSQEILMQRENSHSSITETRIRDGRVADQACNDMRNKGRGFLTSNSSKNRNKREMEQTATVSYIKEDMRSTNQVSVDSSTRKSESRGENDRGIPKHSPVTQNIVDQGYGRQNTHTSPLPTKPSVLNTPPPSSCSSMASFLSSSGPKESKLKRFCFALDEDEDMDIFDSPLNQINVGEAVSKRQDVVCKDVVPTTTTSTTTITALLNNTIINAPITITTTTTTQSPQVPSSKNLLFTPTPVTGTLKMPVASVGVDKYSALVSDDLDDFDFDL